MQETNLMGTGTSTANYYESINKTYQRVYHKLLMLHYPFFNKHGESLEDRQVNLTKHCVSHLGALEGKTILEVGCGNGTQSIYIYENYKPAKLTGIDINAHNIGLANTLNGHHENLEFHVDDAQELKKIPDQSVDVLLCIESAFHYPDKESFIKEIGRVLKPGGTFLIADILSLSYKNRLFLEKWKRKMSYYHWTEEHYRDTFEKNGLHIEYTQDITESIKQGYSGYRQWVSRDGGHSFMDYFKLKLFVFIQVNVNTYLLKRRRKYFIFKGGVKG